MNRTRSQSKHDPRSYLAEQAVISVMRAADTFLRGAESLLKPWELSGAQYNVLRILRGAGQQGLACGQIGERLISRDPDITRLLDRLDARGFITRARETGDRRVVKTRITEAGLRLLAELDEPIQEFHRRKLGRMPEKELRQLLHLLERARALTAEAETEESRISVASHKSHKKESSNEHSSQRSVASQHGRGVAD